MKFDEQGRLRVYAEGLIVNLGSTLEILNNGNTIAASASYVDFSNSFYLTSSDGVTVYVNGNFGNVSTIGTSSFEGTSSLLARSDHIHAHGDQPGGTLHSLVTTVSAGFMSSADKVKLDAISGSGYFGYNYERYQTISQPVSASPAFNNVTFQSARIANSLYTINAGNDTITFISAGLYEIKYRVSIDDTNNNRAQSLCVLLLNGNQVSGSFAYGFHSNAGQGQTTNVGIVYLQIAANDNIRVVSQKQSGGGNLVTVPNGTNILINRWT